MTPQLHENGPPMQAEMNLSEERDDRNMESRLLEWKGIVSIEFPPTELYFFAHTFFHTTPGLKLEQDFAKALETFPKFQKRTACKLDLFHLLTNAHDSAFEHELPKPFGTHIWHLGWLLSKQLYGGEGPLLSRGEENYFYIDTHAISARYVSNVWVLNETPWDSEIRFSGSRIITASDGRQHH